MAFTPYCHKIDLCNEAVLYLWKLLSYNEFLFFHFYISEYPMVNLHYVVIGVIVLLVVLIIFLRKRKKRSSAAHYYPESEQLYVGNLSYQVNSFHLKDFFSQYGDVSNVRLIKNKHTGRSKGFAFVTFANVKEAKKALTANGKDLRGRPIVAS